jgi:nitrilase
VQAAPVLFDLGKTVEKTLALIKEAAVLGAKVVVFPESFIPCYPRGLSFGITLGSRTDEGRKDFQRYYENSVAVPGPVVDVLEAAAK